MTVTTVFAGTADADIRSRAIGGPYSSARSGSDLTVLTAGNMRVGQTTVFDCYESFWGFDTSSIPDGDSIDQVDLSLYGTSDQSLTDFTVEARSDDWGTSVTAADWVAGADLGGLTLLATYATSGGWSTTGYNAFTESGTAFRTAINVTGTTRILVCSDRHRIGNEPSQSEYVESSSADETGTTQDPKLVVTHTASLQGPNVKVAGTFTEKQAKVKVAGTFQDATTKVKVGGSFVDA